jgi:hypothetical protein
MEHYNKEKHYGLVLEHIKKAALEYRELDMHSRYDNYGNVLVELFINETESIIIRNEDFREICNEVYAGPSYYQVMIDYIVQQQNSFFTGIQCHQGTSVDPMASSRMIRAIKEYKR